MSSPWEIEGVHDALVKMLKKGMSAGQTTAALNRKFGLNLTRNAVISRANRTNVPFARTVNKIRTSSRKRLKLKTTLALPGKAMPLAAEPLPEDDPTDIPLKAFADLEDRDCRQRIDGKFRGDPWGFCGRETVPGLPYCRKHAARNYANWVEIAPRVLAKKREVEPV